MKETGDERLCGYYDWRQVRDASKKLALEATIIPSVRSLSATGDLQNLAQKSEQHDLFRVID